jgi:hypothetical protein
MGCNQYSNAVTTPKRATSAHRPEEVLVLLRVRGHEAPIGQHHVDAQEVVDVSPWVRDM